MRAAVLLLAIGAALALAGVALGGLRHSTVVQAVRVPERGALTGAHLLLRRADVARFSSTLGGPAAARVAAVDYRRFVVVAAFSWLPDPCYRLRITSLERNGRRLAVRAVRSVERLEHEGCIQVIAAGYHVVKVRRSAFRGRLPTRAVLRAETQRPGPS